MKTIFNKITLLLAVTVALFACQKDLDQVILVQPASVTGFTSTVSQLTLSDANKNTNVVTFKFDPMALNIATTRPTYTLQFDVPADTTGATAWSKAVNVKLTGDSTEKSFTGADFNSMLVNQLKLATGTQSKVVVRLKAEITQSSGAISSLAPLYSKIEMLVTPYKVEIIYPALLVKGGNSWVTPATRTNGFVLTSVGFDSKYEGYLNLPNSDGWGGEGFTLQSTTNNKIYGWGTSATTIAEGTGNLWLTPAPNYMKVNVDLAAGTISYLPVKFYVTGDHNNWNTSANPMTYNPTTKKLEATNVSLTAGKKIVFTANGGYDLSYKVDSEGKIVFAGPPNWGGTEIIAPQTGTFKVTLDLSQGNGKYTYSIE